MQKLFSFVFYCGVTSWHMETPLNFRSIYAESCLSLIRTQIRSANRKHCAYLSVFSTQIKTVYMKKSVGSWASILAFQYLPSEVVSHVFLWLLSGDV